ncbi:APC family amino acid-polyamine-organocation transporter [Lactobacillus psittaci DSM 15354]|uniref:APC family amino acid-polyamine-organocation transporter n=1 Tax=Lactobacillus psittaci DSM 15354 TaxID=1122152 RepID=A0A0R1S403_9LACO|nr:APC family amino acid-polyamine-organocation transporter [Lactobacillus psittaci DSM 15354]
MIALMDFVTVIGFDDIIYNFQNQGLQVIGDWILLLILFVIPYELIVGHLGSTFPNEGGGLTSWIRHTSGDKMGYITAWSYWVISLPYLVDVANSTVVALGWLVNGNNSMQDKMSNQMFALLTALIFVVFIFCQHRFANSLQILSILGGGAMFVVTILYVIMTVVYLGKGGQVHTQPFNIGSFIPKFDMKFLMSLGLLIFAMNGSEFIAPYVNEMKDGKHDFPKAMYLLAVMTGFLTIFGSFALGVFFNAHHLPSDLKMNGSYYAFQAMGNEFGMGKLFLYIFIITQALYMLAQLAVLVDGGARIFLSDTAKNYLPRFLTKTDKNGLPINGYWLTTFICTVILVLSATLPTMNDIFNQLLNLNGIISPYVTSLLFWAFIKVRMKPEKFQSEYTFIKNRTFALIVGWWCFILTIVAATFSIIPIDAQAFSDKWWHMLILNIVEPAFMIILGIILPLIAKWERNKNK